MPFDTFGTLFSFTTFGESHGVALGAVISGFPSNFHLDIPYIESILARRRPGSTSLGTKRNESDALEILSGVFEGVTTGAPICMIVRNHDQKSSAYDDLKDVFRPGSADYTWEKKYGFRDYRGGGRASGRETVGRVMAGALAMDLLRRKGITLSSAVIKVGKIEATDYEWTPPFPGPLYAPECKEHEAMIRVVEEMRRSGDSIGSVVECHASGVPIGLGEPVFNKLDQRLSSALMSIGAVKAVEIGNGTEASSFRGSEANDRMSSSGFLSNNAGGILGGISTGEDIITRVHFKPTPSISVEQETITKDGKDVKIRIGGRHDPIIAPRAAVVVEAMTAAVILDELLISEAYKG